MAYTQSYILDETKTAFKQVCDAESCVVGSIATAPSPFVHARWHRKFYRYFMRSIVRLLSRLLQTRLFVADTLWSLQTLSPETRSLLEWLSNKNYIKSWHFNIATPGYPFVASLFIKPTAIQMPSGRRYTMTGAVGNGCGTTLEEASKPAIGEFIERLATSSDWWKRGDLRVGSYFDFKAHGSVPPHTFVSYNEKVHLAKKNNKGTVDEHTSMTWITARTFLSGKKVQVPAAAIYTFFNTEHPKEPIFSEVSSNGAAAHTTKKQATYNAVLELVERDTFLKSWYHQRVGRRIVNESISTVFPEYKNALELIARRGIKFTAIDITDDLDIPTVASIILNKNKSSRAVTVTAASDIDMYTAMKKILKESVRFIHGRTSVFSVEDDSFIERYKRGTQLIESYTHREKLWSHSSMSKAITWYVSGDSITCMKCISGHRNMMWVQGDTSLSERYAVMQRILQGKKIAVYTADTTNTLARYVGIKVVKAVSPDLIPMFFNEAHQPLRFQRFTHDSHGKKVQINLVPHPFL